MPTNVLDLTTTGTLGGDELIYCIDDPSGTPADRKTTPSEINGYVLSQVTDLSSAADGKIIVADGSGNMKASIYTASSGGGGGASAINGLTDVTITSPADNELLAYDTTSGDWINQTPSEAGLAEASHNHAASDITSGTMADARIAQSNVTQHQAALSITESQISDLTTFIRTLLDDVDAATARTTLGVDPAGTDNSTDVTLGGTPTYLTLSGQQLIRALINLAEHVTGTLPLTNGGTGLASIPANGQLLIGNGTGYALATLTAGSNITITNTAGGITIAASGGGGGSSDPYAVAGTASEVKNTATRQVLFSFTLTGGDMSANGMIQGNIFCAYKTLAGQGYTLDLKLGSTTIATTHRENAGDTETDRSLIVDFLIQNVGSTSSQAGWIKGLAQRQVSGQEPDQTSKSGLASEDTTGNLTVEVGITLSSASTSLGYTRQAASAVLVSA